ncbi:PREDICTED: uncharacterized protein LOC105361704 [Ceratosolen solmsi marchali]|uniref:Uncharacterized protein LOC105361704 n=1 Tax=Ceratosolen solmsi marchali TaxID=326594 RepID=A0AAJ6YFS3_9HYME|nr:PREDICTED: uncharacterized protein LOC105361704 [Ceratosolen solmsi marchali]
MNNFNNTMESSLKSIAQMSIGQAVLKLADKTLYIIEKSVQWSLPTQDIAAEVNGKSFGKFELVRPLPWFLFLPSLIILRIFRFGLNTVAGILGYTKIEPSDMIFIIQKSRRRVRNIKMNGLQIMRQKKIPTVKDRTMTIKEASKNLANSLRLILSTLSCLDSGSKTSPSPPPTKIKVSSILNTTQLASKEKKRIESTLLSPMPRDSKRKYSEISSENYSESESDDEPLVSKIEKITNEFGSDKDFCPIECSTSDDNEFSESEVDVSVSLSEAQDLQIEKMWCGNPECRDTLCNNQLHVNLTTRRPRPQRLITLKRINTSENFIITAEKPIAISNEVDNEQNITHYSFNNWKSASTKVLFAIDKLI